MSLWSDTIRPFVAREAGHAADAPLDRLFAVAARWWPLVLLLVCAVLFLPGLGIRPLRGEEGRRALQAMAMLEHGAWWHLQVLDVSYANKPPFLPWTIAWFAALLGRLDEIAVRLPIVLSAAAGALGAGALARRMDDSGRANLSALLAGLTFLLIPYIELKGRIAETDVPSIALTGLGFMAWAFGRLSPSRRIAWWALSAAFLAVSALTRGPIPIAFAAIPMLVTGFRGGKRSEGWSTVGLLLLSLAPCLIWAGSNAGNHEADLWARQMRLVPEISLREYVLSLLALGRIPQAFLLLLPWIVLALAWAVRRKSNASDGVGWLVRALLLYVGPLSIFVLLWPDTRERYAMPIAWPVAVLAGVAMATWWSRHVARMVALALALWAAGQAVVAFGFDGRSADQLALRHDAETLRRIIAATSPGEVAVVVSAFEREPDFRLFAYAQRTLPHVPLGAIGPGVRYIAADATTAGWLLASGRWKRLDNKLASTKFMERVPQALNDGTVDGALGSPATGPHRRGPPRR